MHGIIPVQLSLLAKQQVLFLILKKYKRVVISEYHMNSISVKRTKTLACVNKSVTDCFILFQMKQ